MDTLDTSLEVSLKQVRLILELFAVHVMQSSGLIIIIIIIIGLIIRFVKRQNVEKTSVALNHDV